MGKLMEQHQLEPLREPDELPAQNGDVSSSRRMADDRKALLALCETGRLKWDGGKPAGLRGIRIQGGPLAKTILDERR